MKLYCKGTYHHGPMNLHFDHPGVVELDDWKARYVLADAPDNFTTELPTVSAEMPGPVREPAAAKALDAPPADKQTKAPAKKK